jgi:uncharacterized protein YecE (DUF72 family)
VPTASRGAHRARLPASSAICQHGRSTRDLSRRLAPLYARRKGRRYGRPTTERPPRLARQEATSLIPHTIRIGTAGWSIPKASADAFGDEGTHLQRYARVLPAVEINSSFYRPHKPATYERWAASVPPGFRFAVKVPRDITHTRRLVRGEELLGRFLEETGALGHRRGPLLVQLPPSLDWDPAIAGAFLDLLRARFDGQVVCEPRHPTWFTDAVDRMLSAFRIARVAADPAPVPRAAEPGGWDGLVYRRLHGSPRMYYSAYTPAYLAGLARRMRETAVPGRENWCIFDNTALGEATSDALALMQRVDGLG